MKKIILPILALFLTVATVNAKPVPFGKAKRVADIFYHQHSGSKAPLINAAALIGGLDNIYLFVSADESSFVVVAGNDCVEPILAYSFQGYASLEELPISTFEWLQIYDEQIKTLTSTGYEAPETTRQRWEEAMNESLEEPQELTDVAPLLTTTWNQSPYYNLFCPLNTSNNSQSPVGCVATAMAQIMKYWNHPQVGYGSYSYNHSTYGNLSANFGTTHYDWSNMPNSLLTNRVHTATGVQDTAVALLSYHCGVAVAMNYGPSSSGAQTIALGGTRRSAEQALRTHFGYKNSLKGLSRMSYTEAQWINLMKTEINAGRPVLHSGASASGGHAFVCDGYDSQNRFHFNWGWGGSFDGFFANNALYPQGGGVGSNAENSYNTNQTITIGIEPEWDFALNYNDGFEQGLAYWRTADANNDGLTFEVATTGSRSGSHCATSLSYRTPGGTTNADNWMISPRIHLPSGSNNATLTWYVGATNSSYFAEHYSVYISTTTSEVSSFTTQLLSETLTRAAYTQKSINLSAYAGRDIYIAFRHHATSNGRGLKIDDVAITASSTAQYTITGLSSNAQYGQVSGSTTATAGTTHSLRAEAEDGYRFVRWSDGSYFNPRSFVLNRDITLTALFEPANGDTIMYHNSTATGSSFGNSSGSSWIYAIKLEPSQLRGHRLLTQVMLNNTKPGNHQIRIYKGGTSAPQTLLYSQDTNLEASNVWHAIVLDTVQQIDTTTTLWVAIYTNGISYSAKALAYGGNNNGSWSSSNGSSWDVIEPNYYYSWAISAIFDGYYVPVGQHSLTATSTDSTKGTVTGSGIYPHGSTITVRAIPASGYRFSQWDDGDTTNPRQIQLTYNRRMTAQFNTLAAKYISVASNNASLGTVTGQGFFEPNSYDTLSAYANESSRFTCWNDGQTANPRIITVDRDSSFTAMFTPLSGDTLYYDNGSHATSYGYNSTSHAMYWGIRLPSSLLSGRSTLQAAQVYINTAGNYTMNIYQGGTDAPEQLIYTKDVTLTGGNMWYTITPDSTVSINATKSLWVTFYNIGVTFPASVSYSAGNVNQGFYSGDGTTWREISASGRSYTAMVRAILPTVHCTRTLTVLNATPAWGAVTGSGTFNCGSTTTITATANPGCHFVQWNDGNTQSSRMVTITNDATYTATFAQDQHIVTGISNNPQWGSVNGSGTYTHGSTAILRAQSAHGCHFVQWNDGSTDSTLHITVVSDMTFAATFERNQYLVEVQSNDLAMGAVTGGGLYFYGDTATISASPNTGYKFMQWDNGSTESTLRIIVVNNTTISATFEREQYMVEVQSSDLAMGTVTGGGLYFYGDTATITATPNAGYKFERWDNGERHSSFDLVVVAPTNLTALFSPEVGIQTGENSSANIHTRYRTIIIATENNTTPIYIYDAIGHLVQSFTENHAPVVSATMPAAGMYIVMIGNGVVEKVVVK